MESAGDFRTHFHSFPVFWVSYPVIFAVIAALMGAKRENWLMDVLLLCLTPTPYWMVLMPSENKMDLSRVDFTDMTYVMFWLMPIVIARVLLIGYVIRKRKKQATVL